MRVIPVTPAKLTGDVLEAAHRMYLDGTDLANWADALLSAGFDTDKIIEAVANPGMHWKKVRPLFIDICRELGVSDDPYAEIQVLMQEVWVEEYQRGYRGAAQLVWKFDELRKRIGFPQPIHVRLLEDNDDGTNDSGFYSDDRMLHDSKLEELIRPYLERVGIRRQQG